MYGSGSSDFLRVMYIRLRPTEPNRSFRAGMQTADELKQQSSEAAPAR